jgi:SAM-dependent methyltransferase
MPTSREKSLADGSFSTAASYQRLAAIMGLPEDVAGLRIVDIGSGASNAVARLNERGAIASGVDPGYFRINRLLRSAQREVSKSKQTNPRRFRADIAALEEFERDQRINGDRYIAGYAGELPFDDNSIDIVYSQLAISVFLADDREVMFKAVDEALRVLKPTEDGVPNVRRSVILQPWISRFWESRARIANATALQASLSERGIPFFVEQIDPQVSPRIRIVKP